MANYLSVGTAVEKNKLFSDVPFLNFLEVDILNLDKTISETIYLVNNPEDVEYLGRTYTAVAFDLDIKKETSSIPTLTMSFVDPTGAMEGIIQQHKGMTGSPVRVMFVNTSALDQPPEISENFEILYTASAGFSVTVTLGAENPLNKRCPKRKCYKHMCSWLYKSKECGYTGDIESCDYSLTGSNGCRVHENSARFGGFPGMTV